MSAVHPTKEQEKPVQTEQSSLIEKKATEEPDYGGLDEQ